jgi:hypothetical protein
MDPQRFSGVGGHGGTLLQLRTFYKFRREAAIEVAGFGLVQPLLFLVELDTAV